MRQPWNKSILIIVEIDCQVGTAKPMLHTFYTRLFNRILSLSVGLAAIYPPQDLFAQGSWSVSFPGIGTFSSPRVTDLNGDGIGDVILGAGREEFQPCDSAVIALDGQTGKMLWHVSAIDQIFGSASLKDINGDQVQDAIIGGRSGELIAINGRTGEVIWRFDKKARKEKWYGFYNAQFIKDQDQDGLDDFLTSNGGNNFAEPYDSRKRPPGTLVVISSRTGKLIALAKTPDKKETYMSVSALPVDDGKDYKVIFGTGGETVGGNLFVTTLSEILKGDLSKAKLLASSPDHGFVAPAVWADITGDKIPDIIANAVEGKLVAFDGATYKLLWSVKETETEAYSSIATGYFTDDKVPDFFVSYAVGKWPKLEWSRQLMVNGATGKLSYLDSLGFYQTSTPVVMDFEGDGRDEAILSVNVHAYDALDNKTLNNMLMVIGFKNHETFQFSETITGSNISTTPWIGDMDNDGLLDVVYCHATNPTKPYTFDGISIHRMATKIPIKSKIKWGAYMGSKYDGIFEQ